MSFNVNNDAAVQLTNKLEKLSRSAFPIAIRQTLTNTARDVKTRSLLKVTSAKFTIRNKNFFKVASGFLPAKGFDIKTMRAIVGFFPSKVKASKDLDKQEFGGSIKGRSFIPTPSARVGGNKNKKVKVSNRLSNIRIKATIAAGNKKSFRRKTKKIRIGQSYLYGKFLFRAKSFKRGSNGAKFFNSELLYVYERGRSANIDKGVHFMREAALLSRKKMLGLYKKEAERQFKRVLKR